jgi:uncharacterized protein (TIGR01777 family)
MATPRYLIAGGTGLIGAELAKRLRERGAFVDILTRGDTNVVLGDRPEISIHWEPGVILELSVDDYYDAVINLAGESISRMPWTRKRKERILYSRLDATKTLVAWIKQSRTPPTAFINASAVGVYGSRGDEVLTEESQPGSGFLAEVVRVWEAAATDLPEETRVAYLRTGIVLAPRGGALAPLRALTKAFLGGPLGGGKQWWPWISLEDEVRAIMHVIDSDISGPVNLVGPTPVTSGEAGRLLAQKLKRPFWLPAPGFAIRALLGAAGRELLLPSQKIQPTVLETTGFAYTHTTVEAALDSALSPSAAPTEQ